MLHDGGARGYGCYGDEMDSLLPALSAFVMTAIRLCVWVRKGICIIKYVGSFFSAHYVVLSLVMNFLIFVSVYCYINKFVESRYKGLAV